MIKNDPEWTPLKYNCYFGSPYIHEKMLIYQGKSSLGNLPKNDPT